MGTMPMIMASAVISTGRRRTKPAFRAAWRASPTRISNCSRAKLTTRMELDVATPMHMMAPVSAGTLSRVLVRKQKPDDAGQRRRQRRDDEEGIEPGLEVDHDEQVDQQDGKRQSGEQADVGLLHGLALPAQDEVRAAGQIVLDGGR